MVPSFFPGELTEKILLIGKTKKFMQRVCGVQEQLFRDAPPLDSMDVAQGGSVELTKIVNSVYTTVSKRLLEILYKQFKFVDHLHAIRRYLLLGQGDFIRHLMDVLHKDLAGPASALYIHNLTSTLETAVRATNAQYDDPDTLSRLDVQLFEVSPGDVGWDVFSLVYRVDGPIRTVFNHESMATYLKIFNFLWRTKRMEFYLAEVWSKQMSFARSLSQVTELKGVLKMCQTMHAAMSHFVNQIQYYFVFEVLECSWHELLKAVETAEDLDQLIKAHGQFLETIVAHAMLGPESKAMLSQLRSIFDVIVNFKSAQEGVYEAGSEELARRNLDTGKAYEASLAGQWGVTDPSLYARNSQTSKFLKQVLPEAEAKLRVLMRQFKDMVGRFLTMLMSKSDANLRFLSFRVDFNEFYRREIPEYSDACSPFQSKTRSRRTVGRSGLSQPSFTAK